MRAWGPLGIGGSWASAYNVNVASGSQPVLQSPPAPPEPGPALELPLSPFRDKLKEFAGYEISGTLLLLQSSILAPRPDVSGFKKAVEGYLEEDKKGNPRWA